MHEGIANPLSTYRAPGVLNASQYREAIQSWPYVSHNRAILPASAKPASFGALRGKLYEPRQGPLRLVGTASTADLSSRSTVFSVRSGELQILLFLHVQSRDLSRSQFSFAGEDPTAIARSFNLFF